ncbi:Double-stranded RNA-binding domain [Hirschfeldia incana]|nr:Double-stranded RNA-binding domain [Hirschfeldia incana]
MAGQENNQALSPKDIIHETFGVEASYRIEQVRVPYQNAGLYRCHLQLPQFSVISNVFNKKNDAEQSAAELALEKLGIHPQDDITVEQAWDDIVQRIKYIFSDEFLSSDHPLGSHLRATLQNDGERRGSVPLSVIAAFDAKINSRCKVINPSVDQDPILAMSYVMKAAAKLSNYIVVSPHVASLRKKTPYPPATVEALATHGESIKVEGVYIKCATRGEEVVDPVTLDISSGRYYLDIIAEKLGLKDSSQLIISRTFGKTSSGYECRVYSAIPKLSPDKSSKAYGKRPVDDEEHQSSHKPWNAKASYVCGQDIHGDAIVAAVGYTWRSHNLEHDDLTLKSFHRICCGMSPNGIYKFSRQALIAAQLPFSFTTKSTWRGPLPREMLYTLCRQQQLSEPIFTISTSPVKPLSDILRSFKKLKDSENDNNNQCVNEYAGSDDSYNHYNSKDEEELPVLKSGYRCDVKILSKSQDLVLDCSSGNFYEKESHAIQNAALKALTWFSSFFEDLDADPEQPRYTNGDLNWMFTRNIMIKGKFPSSKRYEQPASESKNMYTDRKRKRVQTIPNGSLVIISYSVSVEVDTDFSGNGKCLKELIESNVEIEFEVGNGSMNPHLESVVTQMSVGQYACFITNMPAEGLVLAAANDTVRTRSLLSGLAAGLEYNVHLLGVKGPTEKRVEAVFFKPPLSKQRVEYAVKLIKESSASILVDFGCGSGSLLEPLLEAPTSLQTIIGVDISQKALTSAAKMLDSKLSKGSFNLKSVRLYDGSILEFDSRLHGIDIATCLEVIEHMEEDEAFEFGKTVLSLFRPKLLIVSTPNYEYNRILHKSSMFHSKDRSMSQRSKFRNHDHKFEWTRAQFNNWASKLAKRHNYSVEFSGVGGGSGNVEPGFASQIAVFKRKSFSEVKKFKVSILLPYHTLVLVFESYSSGTENEPSVAEKRVPSITNSSVVSICYSVSLEVDPDFSTDGEVSEGNEDMESKVFNSIAETEPSDVKLGVDLLSFMQEELRLCPSRKGLDFLLHACVNAKDKQTALVVWKEYQFAELPYNVLNYLRQDVSGASGCKRFKKCKRNRFQDS